MNTFIITLPGLDPIQVPFCCPLPEPAFLIGPLPGKWETPEDQRQQTIECVNCGRTIVNLAWEPVAKP